MHLNEPLIVKAQRASYMLKRALWKKCSPAMAIEIFARTVEPILLYAVEVWGPLERLPAKNMPALDYRLEEQENHLEIDRIKIDFVRWVLQARRNTPWMGIWGEIGAPPLAVEVSLRVATFFQ